MRAGRPAGADGGEGKKGGRRNLRRERVPVVVISTQCLREARPSAAVGGEAQGPPQPLRPWHFSVSNQPSRALVRTLVPTRQALSGLPGERPAGSGSCLPVRKPRRTTGCWCDKRKGAMAKVKGTVATGAPGGGV